MDNGENIRNIARLRPALPASDHRSRSLSDSCCACCMICFSYILCLISSSIIVWGGLNFFRTSDNLWLVVSGCGLLLILIGASIYRGGVVRRSSNDIRKRNKRSRYKRGARESHIFESHLSINMLPQCFSSLEIPSTTRGQDSQNPNQSPPGHLAPIETNTTFRMAERPNQSHSTNTDQQNPQPQLVGRPISAQIVPHPAQISGSVIDHHHMSEDPVTRGDEQEEEEMNEAPPSYEEVVAEPNIMTTLPPSQPNDTVYRTL